MPGGPHFDLAVAHAHVEARLRMNRRAVEDRAVFERETRAVPRTAHAVAFQLAFGERAAEVRTALNHRKDAPAAPRQQYARAVGFDAPQLAFGQVGVGHHGDELRWRLLADRVVDADLLAVDQVPAQVSGGA